MSSRPGSDAQIDDFFDVVPEHTSYVAESLLVGLAPNDDDLADDIHLAAAEIGPGLITTAQRRRNAQSRTSSHWHSARVRWETLSPPDPTRPSAPS